MRFGNYNFGGTFFETFSTNENGDFKINNLATGSIKCVTSLIDGTLSSTTLGTIISSNINDYIINGTSLQTANYNITGSGTHGQNVISGAGYGFQNATYLLAQNNPIWAFATASTYGIGYNQSDASGDDIRLYFGDIANPKHKFKANGDAIHAGAVNATGYLLNSNNLFSSLSTGYLPYWDGGKFVNSKFVTNGTSIFLNQTVDLTGKEFQMKGFFDMTDINNSQAIRWYDGTTFRGGSGSDSGAAASINDITIVSANDFIYRTTTSALDRMRLTSAGKVIISDLASTNAQLLSSSSTGQLTPVSNAAGYLFNDGSGNFSNSYPEITSLRSTGATNGFVATANGSGGVDFRVPLENVSVFQKQKSPLSIFNKAHSSVVLNDQLFLGTRGVDPKIIRFSDINNLGTFSSTTVTGSGTPSGGLECGYYVSSINKICFSVKAAAGSSYGTDIVELDPSTMTYIKHTFTGATGSFQSSETDGTYIYLATSDYFKKIRVSDWVEVTSIPMTLDMYYPHSMKYNPTRNELYLTGANGDYNKFILWIVNTTNLSHVEVDLSQYIYTVTDDMCYYESGSVCKLFIGGERSVGNYGGAVVDITASNALSGLETKPSYGMFIIGEKVYNCASDGFIQTFSALDPTNISTFPSKLIIPNEILATSSQRTFFTNWDESTSYLSEFYIPVTMPELATLTNPMTTTGDIIYSSSGSTPTRRVIGSTNQVLTVVGGVPTWQTPSSGFTDPMTTRGDLVYRNFSNVTARLGIGSSGQLLGSNGTDVSWVNPPSGTSQWTTDTYGITYANNVGIGAASTQYDGLFVYKNIAGGNSAWFQNTSASGSGIGIQTTDASDSYYAFRTYGNSVLNSGITNGGSFDLVNRSTSPVTASGMGRIYAKTDGKLYFKNSSGTETDLTLGGSGGGSGTVTSVSASTILTGDGGNFATVTVTNPTTTPNIPFVLASQTQKKVLIAPTATSGTPTYRQLLVGDISATGTPSSSTYLRGDGSWSTVASGGIPYPAGSGIAIVSGGSSWGTTITLPGGTTSFLRADGTFATPASGTNYWQRLTGAVAPVTITDEVRIGSTSDMGSYILQAQGNARVNGQLSTFYTGGASSYSIFANSNGTLAAGLMGNSGTGDGLYSYSSGGGIGAKIETTRSTTNSSIPVLQLNAETTTTPSVGMGGYQFFTMQNSTPSSNIEYGRFGVVATDVTTGSVDGKFQWGLAVNGTVTNTMTLTNDGNLTAYNFTSSSDRRLKKNIKAIDFSKGIDDIKFVQFTMKNDSTNRLRFGVVAQDVEKILPNVVHTDDEGMKSVSYIDLLVAKMARMEERLNELEFELNEIKNLKNEK
jgi:hypothetical protein